MAAMAEAPYQSPSLASYAAKHVVLKVEAGLAEITLNRPERKNPLTFDSYAELLWIFQAARADKDVKVFIISGSGGNFSSGGDVHEIIAPLRSSVPRSFSISPA
jgi:enoyl-CoA hydratase/carnithine racemase